MPQCPNITHFELEELHSRKNNEDETSIFFTLDVSMNVDALRTLTDNDQDIIDHVSKFNVDV